MGTYKSCDALVSTLVFKLLDYFIPVFIGKITVDDGKVIASMSNVEHIACTDSVAFYDWHEELLNIVGLSDRVLNGRIDLTPGSRAGLEPRSGGKSVAVQPIVSVWAHDFLYLFLL